MFSNPIFVAGWISTLIVMLIVVLAGSPVLASTPDAETSDVVIETDSSPQDAESSRWEGIETVIVTGTMRHTDSQAVPISISTISEQQIANTFRTDLISVGDLAPNVVLAQVAGFRSIAGGIRGTGHGSILVTQDSSVVVQVDEFGLSRVQAQFVPVFDVERVEIFRGPQGTLFGKSATGGAISIVTKRPVIDEFSTDIEYQYGRFDAGSKGDIAKGFVAVNIPVIENKMAIRITGLYDYDEGYYRNDRPSNNFPDFLPIYAGFGNPTPLPNTFDKKNVGDGERLNGTDVTAGTVKALFQPSDNYEAYFIFRTLRDRSDSPPGVNESPFLGQVDPALEAGLLANGVDPATATASAQQFMLLPLLGFDGINTLGAEGPDPPFSTGITSACWHSRAFCIPKGHKIDAEEYHLHQSLALDPATVQLRIGYRTHEEILASTYTGEAFNSLFDASRNTDEEQFQIELRVSTAMEGPFNFVTGTTYATHDVDFVVYATSGAIDLVSFNAGGFFDPEGNLNLRTHSHEGDFSVGGSTQDRESYAFYFDGTYEITDKFRLTAGLRYTHDEKTFFRRSLGGGPCTAATPPQDEFIIDGECLDILSNNISRAIGEGFELSALEPFTVPLPNTAFGNAHEVSDSWNRTTWRLVLDYQIAKDVMTYASYSTGFIPGGFTETCASAQTCVAFDSETNWNLEGGIKSQWFDRKLQFNLALFYTKYYDLVRTAGVPYTNKFGVKTSEGINLNAGKSEVSGVELEAAWMPIENLRFNLGVGYMDHSYIDFVMPGNGFGGIENADLSSLTVPYSPNWNVVAGITYEMRMGNSGSLTWNTNSSYRSEVEFSVFNSLTSQSSARTLWDASVTYRDVKERYRVSLFVKNILDERYRTGASSVTGLWNFTMYGRPREFGAEVGIYF
jgi:iron complex outermembrane receptor protein